MLPEQLSPEVSLTLGACPARSSTRRLGEDAFFYLLASATADGPSRKSRSSANLGQKFCLM